VLTIANGTEITVKESTEFKMLLPPTKEASGGNIISTDGYKNVLISIKGPEDPTQGVEVDMFWYVDEATEVEFFYDIISGTVNHNFEFPVRAPYIRIAFVQQSGNDRIFATAYLTD
jgi:hypothetical protein